MLSSRIIPCYACRALKTLPPPFIFGSYLQLLCPALTLQVPILTLLGEPHHKSTKHGIAPKAIFFYINNFNIFSSLHELILIWVWGGRGVELWVVWIVVGQKLKISLFLLFLCIQSSLKSLDPMADHWVQRFVRF